MSVTLMTSAEHMFAKAAQDLVASAKFVSSKVLPALKKASASEATVEAITGLVDPNAVNVERAAFAVLGFVIKALDDGGAAASANGMNIALDASLVADIRSIMPAVKTAVMPLPAAA